jgi:hypothetical protein
VVYKCAGSSFRAQSAPEVKQINDCKGNLLSCTRGLADENIEGNDFLLIDDIPIGSHKIEKKFIDP